LAARLAVLNRVIGNAGGGDLFPGCFSAVKDASGHGGGILDQLLAVFTTDAADGVGNDCTQPRDDLLL
jgi:hypothetical protein